MHFETRVQSHSFRLQKSIWFNQLQNNAHYFRKMHSVILIFSLQALRLTMLQHSAFG